MTTSRDYPKAPPQIPEGVPLLEDPEDRTWVEESLQGNAGAFEKLFHKYRQRLFAVTWRIMRNEDSALDVVQEAFVRAFERLDKLRGESSFFPWIRRIAVNLAIDRVRHIRRGVEVSFDEAQYGAGQGSGEEGLPVRSQDRAGMESPPRRAQLSEFGVALERALQELSEPQRTVFLLHAAESMSYKEIAQAVGCNLGTVMSRLFYARKRLQELLGSHLDEVRPRGDGESEEDEADDRPARE